jgi:hypothetical protein
MGGGPTMPTPGLDGPTLLAPPVPDTADRPRDLGTALNGRRAEPAAPLGANTGTARAGGPLAGFTAPAEASERAALGAALGKIASTSVGAGLLAQVSGKGLKLDVMDDAEFAAATGGTSQGAVAVFTVKQGAPPTVLVRAAAMADPQDSSAATTLAHELTHAAQFFGQERGTQYATGLGAAAAQLTPDQLKVGGKLMSEAGSEFVASAIGAQLKDPAGFAANARGKTDTAAKVNWQHVAEEATYNPAGYQLPVYVSPLAMKLVTAAIG